MVKIQIDKSSKHPLYVQVRDRIRQAVAAGTLKPGDRLPPVAAFAKQTGVTQATIRRALEDLTGQGLVHSHVGRGTFVADTDSPVRQKKTDRCPPSSAGNARQPVIAGRRFRRGISKSLCSLVSAATSPGGLDFSKGVVDPNLIAPKVWKKMVALAMEKDHRQYLGYGDLNGSPALREELSKRYRQQGICVDADQIMITLGSQQGAAIAAQDAAENDRHVWVETPGFQGMSDTFAVQGCRMNTIFAGQGLPETPDPLCPSRLLCVCSEFASPTGETMDNTRRRDIALWAENNNGYLFSDQVFEMLGFDEDRPDHFTALMDKSRLIIASSFSKSLISGLRIGWIISSPDRIAEFARLKQLMSNASPSLMEGIALAFLTSGTYDAHLEQVKAIYKKRRDAMLAQLDRWMPEQVSWTRPNGGFFTWVTLPKEYSSIALMLSLMNKGVSFMPGPTFDMDRRFMNCFRLSWAWAGEAEIEQGIKILADAVQKLLGRPPREPDNLLHF